MAIKLRPARMEDAQILFNWRNDPETRLASVHSDRVIWAEHLAWLKKQRALLIAEYHGVPVGTVRIDGTELSWTVAPEHRGEGLGRQIVSLAMRLGPTAARIKATNVASQKIAAAAGFRLAEDGELQVWRRVNRRGDCMKYRPTRVIESAYSRTTWEHRDFPPETTVQDLLTPEMWCHVAKQYLKPLDEIIVIPQSSPFRAHFIVMDKGDTWAKIKLLDVKYLNADEVADGGTLVELGFTHLPEDAPVRIEWKGPALKYSVIRTKDSERLKTGFAIKADAEKWAAEHLLAMA